MQLFDNFPATLPALLGLVLLIGMHAPAVFCGKKISLIFSVVNICLHIVYLFVLVAEHFGIEESVLLYMISIFSYTVMFTARYLYEKRKAEKSGRGKESAA